jgi:4-hydroxybenzoate polyprenyltransferase
MMRTLFAEIRRYLELIRFSHTLFALPFALLAAMMAWAANARSTPPVHFAWRELWGILLCMVFARSAAMAFNRLADRKIDALNPRTKTRHLPAELLSFGSAAIFTAVCALGFIASTLLFLPRNRMPLYASAPVLIFLFSYSYAKRFTALSHFWLGTALALAPLAAWAAIRAEIAAAPLLLGGAVAFWVAGFDILYACQDFDFDVSEGLHSIPARFGVGRALGIAAVCHLAMILFLIILPFFYNEFGWIFFSGVAGISVLLIYEHSLVQPDDLTRVNRAFFHVNAAVGAGLLAAGGLDLLF